MNSDPTNSPTSAASSPPLPPTTIPDHEMIRPIGRGAYGEVWIARSVTGAFRAVKIVRRSSFDHARPFEREFEGILKFEPVSRTHDSQVDILHVGRGEDYFYYVMELADDQVTGGQINPDNYHPRTLKSDLLFHSRLSFEDCVSIGIALTTALEHLHKSDLVHRDVKPSNIIFVNGVAKLADIGLVTGVDTTRSDVGTEGFAAPEGPGTAQADLFSLGKVLYEMSTGKDRQEFPELPTNLRELPDREGLVELNAVIAEACRHDPRDRYANAAVMRADLELLQSGKSLARLHRVEHRLRLVTRAGVVVAVLSVLVVAGWLYQRAQTRQARSLAEHNRRLAAEKSQLVEEKTRLADDSRERLVRLNVANGVRLLDKEPTAALLWFAEALPLVTNNPAESAIHRMRIQQMFDYLPFPVQIIPHERSVVAGAFSEDGRLVATAAKDGHLTVWDAETGISQWTQKTDFPVFQIRFSRDGRNLFVTSSFSPNYGKEREFGFTCAGIVNLADPERVSWQVLTNLAEAAFSPDDRWLVLAQTNHVIRVVDARNGRSIIELPGHSAQIAMLSFSEDGTLLASGGADRTVHLWRLPSGQPVGAPLRHESEILRVVLSRDGRRLATLSLPANGNTNLTVQIWNVETGAGIGAPIPLAISSARVLAFTDPAGKRLMLGGNVARKDRRLYFLDVDTREEVLPARDFNNPRCWAFSPDGKTVAIGEDGAYVSILDPLTGELLFPSVRHNGWIESLDFAKDGSRILATSDEGTAVVWKFKRPSASVAMRFDAAISKFDRVSCMELLNLQQHRLLLRLRDETIRLVDLDRMAEIHRVKPTVTTNAPHLALSQDARHWAARPMGAPVWGNETTPETVDLWCEHDGTLRHFRLEHPLRVGEMQFDPTSTYLLTHCGDQRVRFWKTSDGTLERTISVPEGIKRDVRFFPDGRTALFHRRDNLDYLLFDLDTKEIIGQPIQISPIRTDIKFLDFDLESARFATATEDNCGRIWSARTAEPLTPPFRQGGRISCVFWSPDRRRIITAGLGGTKIWDSTTGELALPQLGDSSPGIATWSLDGRFIVGPATLSREARIWDADTAEPVTPLIQTEGYLRLAAIVGNRLITLSDPNELQAWELRETNLPIDIIADYARLLSGRRLNASGVPIVLKPRELAELFHALRARAPEIFRPH